MPCLRPAGHGHCLARRLGAAGGRDRGEHAHRGERRRARLRRWGSRPRTGRRTRHAGGEPRLDRRRRPGHRVSRPVRGALAERESGGQVHRRPATAWWRSSHRRPVTCCSEPRAIGSSACGRSTARSTSLTTTTGVRPTTSGNSSTNSDTALATLDRPQADCAGTRHPPRPGAASRRVCPPSRFSPLRIGRNRPTSTAWATAISGSARRTQRGSELPQDGLFGW